MVSKKILPNIKLFRINVQTFCYDYVVGKVDELYFNVTRNIMHNLIPIGRFKHA